MVNIKKVESLLNELDRICEITPYRNTANDIHRSGTEYKLKNINEVNPFVFSKKNKTLTLKGYEIDHLSFNPTSYHPTEIYFKNESSKWELVEVHIIGNTITNTDFNNKDDKGLIDFFIFKKNKFVNCVGWDSHIYNKLITEGQGLFQEEGELYITTNGENFVFANKKMAKLHLQTMNSVVLSGNTIKNLDITPSAPTYLELETNKITELLKINTRNLAESRVGINFKGKNIIKKLEIPITHIIDNFYTVSFDNNTKIDCTKDNAFNLRLQLNGLRNVCVRNNDVLEAEKIYQKELDIQKKYLQMELTERVVIRISKFFGAGIKILRPIIILLVLIGISVYISNTFNLQNHLSFLPTLPHITERNIEGVSPLAKLGLYIYYFFVLTTWYFLIKALRKFHFKG